MSAQAQPGVAPRYRDTCHREAANNSHYMPVALAAGKQPKNAPRIAALAAGKQPINCTAWSRYLPSPPSEQHIVLWIVPLEAEDDQ